MAEQKFIRIVNWERFQHYKDRNPPWIKLHRELLTSRTWATSDDASRVLAIALMFLASATGNKIPFDPAYIRRVAYLNQDPDLSQLLAAQFIEIENDAERASTVLADASKLHTNARPEKETERETEAEKETNPSPFLKEDFDFSLQKKSGKTDFTQADFDERDLRKLGEAYKEIDRKLRASVGSSQLSGKQVFEWACELAGISVKRGLEVERLGKKWPEFIGEASA